MAVLLIFSIFIHAVLGQMASSGRRLPEYVVSECYGDIFSFDCGPGNKIRINKDFFGVSAQRGSCSYSPGDCITSNPRSNSLIHRYCTGRSECTYYQVERRGCQGYYSNYQQVEYQCVPNDSVIDICSDVHYQATDTYVSSPNFPKNYPPNQRCACVVTPLTSRTRVRLEIVYMAIKYTNPCRDWLRIGRKKMCGTSVDLFSGKRVPVEFISDRDEGHSGFWLHFHSSIKNGVLDIRCGRRHASSWNSTTITTSTVAMTTMPTNITSYVPRATDSGYPESHIYREASSHSPDEPNPRAIITSQSTGGISGMTVDKPHEKQPDTGGFNPDIFRPSPRSIIRSRLRFPRPGTRNQPKERVSLPEMTAPVTINDALRVATVTTPVTFKDPRKIGLSENINQDVGQQQEIIPINAGEHGTQDEMVKLPTDDGSELFNGGGVISGVKKGNPVLYEDPANGEEEDYLGDETNPLNLNVNNMMYSPTGMSEKSSKQEGYENNSKDIGDTDMVINISNRTLSGQGSTKTMPPEQGINNNGESPSFHPVSLDNDGEDILQDNKNKVTPVPPTSTLDQIRPTLIPSSQIVRRLDEDQSQQTNLVTDSSRRSSHKTTPVNYLFPDDRIRANNSIFKIPGISSGEFDNAKHSLQNVNDGGKSVSGSKQYSDRQEDHRLHSVTDKVETSDVSVPFEEINRQGINREIIHESNDDSMSYLENRLNESTTPSDPRSVLTSPEMKHFDNSTSKQRFIDLFPDDFDHKGSEFYVDHEVEIVRNDHDIPDGRTANINKPGRELVQKFPETASNPNFGQKNPYFPNKVRSTNNDKKNDMRASSADSGSRIPVSPDMNGSPTGAKRDYDNDTDEDTSRLSVTTTSYNNNVTTYRLPYNTSITERTSYNKSITSATSYNRNTTAPYERYDNMTKSRNITIKRNRNHTMSNINGNGQFDNTTVVDKAPTNTLKQSSLVTMGLIILAICVGLGLLFVFIVLIAVYYKRKRQRSEQTQTPDVVSPQNGSGTSGSTLQGSDSARDVMTSSSLGFHLGNGYRKGSGHQTRLTYDSPFMSGSSDRTDKFCQVDLKYPQRDQTRLVTGARMPQRDLYAPSIDARSNNKGVQVGSRSGGDRKCYNYAKPKRGRTIKQRPLDQSAPPTGGTGANVYEFYSNVTVCPLDISPNSFYSSIGSPPSARKPHSSETRPQANVSTFFLDLEQPSCSSTNQMPNKQATCPDNEALKQRSMASMSEMSEMVIDPENTYLAGIPETISDDSDWETKSAISI